jgi:hypothetical protein
MSKEKMDEDSRRFLARLANPDLALLERHFSHALPETLTRLYGNKEELANCEFEVVPPDGGTQAEPWHVAFYEPADAESLRHTFHDPGKYFAFANDGFGNVYMVDPREADPPVLFHDHEAGTTEPVAPSISEFMNWPRRKPKE